MPKKGGRPPMEKTDEANLNQLELAKSQGKAYVKALRHMVELVADRGGEKRAGDYVIAYALEKPEGLYHYQEGGLVWKEPQSENKHIEISLRDAADDRFVYGARVFVTLLDARGAQVARHEQHLLWHPWLPHYGRNWEVPGSGEYDIKVEVMPPKMPRHDKVNGRRYQEAVEVLFDKVPIEIETG